MKKSWIILFLIDLLTYYFFSLKIGAIFFIVIVLKILADIGYFTSITLYQGNFPACEFYYTKYVGEYKKVCNEFAIFKTLIKKFNLDKTHSLAGFYFDDPTKVDPK